MISLEPKQKNLLSKQAHSLKPVVMIGAKGLTKAVDAEIDIALTAHELIKIKIAGADRDVRQQMLETISETHKAALVKHIGCIGIFYRPQA